MKCIPMVVVYLCIKLVQGNIDSKLRYFETLKSVEVRSRVKRSADGQGAAYKEVWFSALGRNFYMVMKPDTRVLSNSFKSFTVNEDGHTEPFHINRNEFYTGHLTDGEGVVDAHLEDSQWNIQVAMKDDVYSVEPSWRHLPPSDNHTLIAYRHSDIKWDHAYPHLSNHSNKRQSMCESIHPDIGDGEIDEESEENQTDSEDHGRQKRQAWLLNKNTCNLILVADYLFYDGVGGGFKHRTANYLIGLIQRIDNIYRETLWNKEKGQIGFGFQIKEMRIHNKPTTVAKGEKHYNMKNPNQWDTRQLLNEFSSHVYFGRFCLAHLFTHQSFSGGVLGLAYIGSPRLGTVGGICSPSYTRRGKRHYLNTGWSSSLNTAGIRQLTQESTLVTAHGHNWGSEHDVDTSECAPDSFNKGRYIMYPYAVSGWEENNHIFSPCSRRYVSDVLRAKAFKCFVERKDNVPYCGNGIVDNLENCDAGPDGDDCCTSQCRFKSGASCSPMNSECCENCQMATEDYQCRITSPNSCLQSTKCNGSSYDCPMAEPKSNGTDCIVGGKCYDGICKSFCEVMDMEPCICSDTQSACARCCKHTDSGPEGCKAQGGNLEEGRPCYQGYCSKEGTCTKSTTDLVYRFFDFIEKLTPSKFVEIMRSNIVGTVIVLSLIIWVPASWVFSCIDKRQEKESKDVRDWKVSPYLITSDEVMERKIQVSGIRRLGRPAPPRRALSQSTGSVQSMEKESTV
ncbi:ADAM 17-like protease [Haliotis cracherodii]|uniref:ADAM 17-like protease n=1 Tax=Haliotis cracherodii TaxID=6455 RepID=UPI0039ED557F